MGLFTPAWKKDNAKAMEAAGGSDIKTLWKIVNECGSNGPRITALNRLTELRDNPAAVAKLRDISENCPNKFLRCIAAEGTGDEELLKNTVKKYPISAFTDPLTEFYEPRTEWLRFLGSYEIKDMCKEAKSAPWEKVIWDSIDGKDTIKAVLTGVPFEKEDSAIIKSLLSRLEGSHADYQYIVRQSHTETVLNHALKYMDRSDEDFLREYLDLKPQIYKIYVADLKYYQKPVAIRLVELFPEKYLYYNMNLASDETILKGIESGIIPENQLRDLAVKYKYSGENCIAWQALIRITNPKELALVLSEKDADTFEGSNKPVSELQKEWNTYVLEHLSGTRHEDAIVNKLLSGGRAGRISGFDDLAINYLTSETQIFRLASSNHSLAIKAADMLPKTAMKKLAEEAKRSDVKNFAHTKWVYNRMETAGDKVLLDIIRAAITDHQKNIIADACFKIRKEENQKAAYFLVAHIDGGEYFGKYCYMREPDEMEELIFSKIDTFQSKDALISKFAELTKGTDREKEFKDRAAKYLLKDFNKGCHAAWMLGIYDDIRPVEAAWKYGGNDYIRHLLKMMEEMNEYPSGSFTNWIKDIYRFCPDSRSQMAVKRGNKYKKHYDEVAYCASDSCDKIVEYTFMPD